MNWLAVRMLLGNRAKYVAMLFGITFASMLFCQQCSIFCGAMRMRTGQIRDFQDAPIWVLSLHTHYIDDLDPPVDHRSNTGFINSAKMELSSPSALA
jgi:putative ABC transport system permease protein